MDVNHINPVLEAFNNILPQLGLNNIQKKGIGVKGNEEVISNIDIQKSDTWLNWFNIISLIISVKPTTN